MVGRHLRLTIDHYNVWRIMQNRSLIWTIVGILLIIALLIFIL